MLIRARYLGKSFTAAGTSTSRSRGMGQFAFAMGLASTDQWISLGMGDRFQGQVDIQPRPVKVIRRRALHTNNGSYRSLAKPRETGKSDENLPLIHEEPKPARGDVGHFSAFQALRRFSSCSVTNRMAIDNSLRVIRDTAPGRHLDRARTSLLLSTHAHDGSRD